MATLQVLKLVCTPTYTIINISTPGIQQPQQQQQRQQQQQQQKQQLQKIGDFGDNENSSCSDWSSSGDENQHAGE